MSVTSEVVGFTLVVGNEFLTFLFSADAACELVDYVAVANWGVVFVDVFNGEYEHICAVVVGEYA